MGATALNQFTMRLAAVGGDSSRSTGEVRVHETGVNLIMLVDDDVHLRRAVARGLMAAGYKILEADCVRQARQLADVQVADLFLIDLHLPDGHGSELVRHLKQRDPSLPVLVLSGTIEQEERIEAFEAGADDVVGKPVCMTELIKRIEVHNRILRSASALQKALLEVDHMRMYAAEAAALMAHDLNNGLCVAGGNLAFLAEADLLAGDPEAKDAVEATQRALRRMSTLVKNFVDIARSEDGALKAALVASNVRELLRTAASVHHLRGAAAERGIEIDCAPGLEAAIDPILVERILHNLLINATRYVDKKGRVAMSGEMVTSGDKQVLLIRIMNTGPVISAELRAGLFAKYRKGSDRKSQSGMGLYFCRLACEAHGGTIALVDVPDYQTCFEIRMPSVAPADQ